MELYHQERDHIEKTLVGVMSARPTFLGWGVRWRSNVGKDDIFRMGMLLIFAE